MQEYPEDVPPVVIDYRHSETNKDIEATSVHDMKSENGIRTGMCPLTVHGITGEQYVSIRKFGRVRQCHIILGEA